MMSKEKRRVPKLRFPGFTEDWEQRKLNEFLSVSNLKNTENKYNKKNVLSVSGDYGIVNQIEFQGRSFAGASVSNYGVVEKGDIVYTKSPLKLNPYGIIKTNRINNGIVSTLYAIYKTKENCDSKFIEHYFNLDSRLNQYLKPLVNKGAKNDMKVSSENALVGEICFPQITEQAMIADLLDRLDIYITLHQRKLDNLKLKKKALLQKLFPKNGERYPELRFPGFTDAWEQREFSDIFAEVKSGLSRMLSNDDIGLPVVRANNINDGQLNLVDDIKYWYKNDPQGANTNNYLIEQGDILINFINSEAKMGTAAYVTRRPERDTIYTTNILRCKVNDEYNPYFIYSLTFLNSYKNYIASITKPAVNQASFTTVDFKKYSIKIPTVKEQNQIADLIETFNKLITLHQRKLDHLQLQKKALLQQMFV